MRRHLFGGADKRTAQLPAWRGSCSDSACATRTSQFLCGGLIHLKTSRYVLSAALSDLSEATR
ncbi:hypothetical protein C8F00_0958 [Xanthomonas vasicola]